jgi:mRNA interferase ChpB
VKRGDIYLVDPDSVAGPEQQDSHPVLVVSPTAFNEATRLPIVCPVTTAGALTRRVGFGVELTGIRTTGVVRCDQPRVLDLDARRGRRVDTLSPELMDEVLARLAPLFT